MSINVEDVYKISPRVPFEVINANYPKPKKYTDWNKEGIIAYPDSPILAFQKGMLIKKSIRIPIKMPTPIRPPHPAKKGTLTKFAGNLVKNFPELNMSDEELEEVVRSTKSKLVE